MALALNGTPVTATGVFGGNSPASTIFAPAFTTTQAGCIVFAVVGQAGGSTTVSVTGSSIGAFTQVATAGGSVPGIEIYACYAAAALTSEIVTLVISNNYDPKIDVFAISGSNQTSLTGAFETPIGNQLGAFNGSMPQNYTTTHADTVIVGASYVGFSAVPTTANNGFTIVVAPGYRASTLYKINASTGTYSISHDQDGLVSNMCAIALIGTAPPVTDICTGGLAFANAQTDIQPVSALVDNTSAKWLTAESAHNVTGHFVRNQLSGGAATVVSYQVTSANDHPERDPVGWILEGSNNGTTWTTLHTVSKFGWSTRGQVETFNFTNATAYAYYRWSCTELGGQDSGVYKFQVAELRFWTGANATGTNVALGGTLTSSGVDVDALANVIDNNDSTKWGAQPTSGSGYTIGSTLGWWFGYKFASAVQIDAYTLTSGNDAPERDPQDWLFQYSDDGLTYTTVGTWTGEDFPSRDQKRTFYGFTLGGNHIYWRVLCSKRGDNATSGTMQLDEMEMGGAVVATTLTASGKINSSPVLGAPTLTINTAGIAIDGTAHNNSGSTLALTVTLTTTQANDYIIVCVGSNGAGVVANGVSGATLGTFTRIGIATSGSTSGEIWAKFSTAALTSEVITVTQNSSGFITVDAFGVSGSGQTSLVWDASTPQATSGSGLSSFNYTPATANPTMLIATFATDSGPDPSAGSGWTDIFSIDWMLTEYRITTSTSTVACNGSAGVTFNRGVAVGIPQVGGGTTPSPLILYDYTVDYGLNALLLANKIVVCSQQPTTYTEANATYKIGEKTFAAGGTVIPSSPVFVSGHSLLTNMLACYLPGVYGGVPVSGTGPTLSNGAGGAGTVVTTAEGPALRSNTLGSSKGLTATAPSAFKSWTNFTVLWRGLVIGAGDIYCPIVGVSSSDADVVPYYMLNVAGDVDSYAHVKSYYGDAAASETAGSYDATGLYGQIVDFVATATVGGNVTFYVNGVSVGTGSLTTISSSSSTSKIIVNQGIDAVNRSPNASVNMACFWDRALSSGEILSLHNNPYAFLQSPGGGGVIIAGPQDIP